MGNKTPMNLSGHTAVTPEPWLSYPAPESSLLDLRPVGGPIWRFSRLIEEGKSYTFTERKEVLYEIVGFKGLVLYEIVESLGIRISGYCTCIHTVCTTTCIYGVQTGMNCVERSSRQGQRDGARSFSALCMQSFDQRCQAINRSPQRSCDCLRQLLLRSSVYFTSTRSIRICFGVKIHHVHSI
jgi:hypothetical protein